MVISLFWRHFGDVSIVVVATANFGSPVSLLGNWTGQCEKFFNKKILRAKEWSVKEWDSDARSSTVWIIKDSLMKPNTDFGKTVYSQQFLRNVEILVVFSDEAHIPGRTENSARSQVYRHLVRHSQFNVLLSGTLFPCGPGEDANQLLQTLGGSFDDNGKWPPDLARAFRRLFNKKDDEWNVLVFRILIAPFHLRRTLTSTLKGELIIPKGVARPLAFTVLPHTDKAADHEAIQRANMKSKVKQDRTIKQAMDRADCQRFLAWSPIYEDIVEAWVSGQPGSKQRIMESVIREKFAEYTGSGRLRRFCALVKQIRLQREKFIVCSDRLFPLTLVYHVFS
jgi:hypothetical protein